MSQVIAGVYEIKNEIGSGGGGIVYLGRHLRLDKQVVLKADKRSLNTKPEVLRREVDMLKDLSHTYIPQVYDFVQENGVVYTVMDFIEGESLDKLLDRAQIPTQPQIVKWACQLLEALRYLHTHQPHGILHGDIKPANIMLRPSGDVCLIDYNIALALGENGAVKVGFSRGYASPEHYEVDYICRNIKTEQRKEDKVDAYTKTIADVKTQMDSQETVLDTEKKAFSEKSSRTGEKKVMLDVRSDIYSIGATIYHLLSGQIPAQDAREVKPLGQEVCSAAVSAIIYRAMNPNPDMRYQSAEEMLTAFLQLHKRDSRVIRYKRHAVFVAGILTVIFLLGGACSFVGLKQLEQRQTALTLAEYSTNALLQGDVAEAVRLALQAIPTEKSILEAPVTAEARKALTDALGVYQLSDGFKAFSTLALPSAPFKIAVSPDGFCFAAVYAYEVAVFHIEDNRQIAVLKTQNSALSDVIFVDETCIIYAGDCGVNAYDLDIKRTLWTGETATTLAISGDHTVVAAVNRAEDHAIIYRVSDGEKIAECSFGGLQMSVTANDIFADPNNRIFALNEDGSMLAVSFSNGGLIIFNLKHPDENIILFDKSEYVHFTGGFHEKYFAFVGNNSSGSLFGLIDVESGIYLGGYESQDSFLLQMDEQGIYLARGNLLVHFDPNTMKETELAYTEKKNIINFSVGNNYVLVATEDKGFSFYDRGTHLLSSEVGNENCDFVALTEKYAIVCNRNEPTIRILKLENHEQAKNLFSYDARYPHDEARISQDGETAMLFNYQSFCIYRRDGVLVKQADFPNAEQIYDQQFRRSEDGSWLEVIWYDGTVRCYNAEDGNLLSELAREAPKKDLYEEFYTDQYRIASELHTAPKVYDLKSDRLVGELEETSYLTYVTQIGEYIITEYISAAGERYGLLLDSKLQTLAYLPGLCDIVDGMLVFDYKTGVIRQCRLYSLDELVEIGETYLISLENAIDISPSVH